MDATKRLEHFASIIDGWFWETDTDHRFVYLSASVEQITGVPAEWHYGKSRTELRSEHIGDAQWQSHMEALDQRQPFSNFVFKRVGPDGARWLSTSGEPIFDAAGTFMGYRGVARDVTNEIILSERTEWFSAIFDQINESIAIWDENDHMVICNKAFRELNRGVEVVLTPGTTYEAYLRECVAQNHFPDAESDTEGWIAERLERHRNPTGTFEIRRQDDQVFQIDEQRLDGGQIALVASDISGLKRVETDMQAARETAEQANRAKTEFLASMSHEIRTPMTGVLGISDLLLKTSLTDEQKNYIDSIQISGRGLLGIINDILDQSKIEAGKLDVEKIGFQLRPVIDEAISHFTPQTREKDLWLTVAVDDEIPAGVHGDPTRIRQVLFNLIGNAIKFTSSGGIAIHVTQREDECVHFQIKDTGEGIATEAQDNLFEQFRQADASTSRRFGGSGLGLSICKSLIELMDGEIGFDSTDGQGSTFWFQLPLTRIDDFDDTAEADDRAISESIVAGKRLQILVAEDNEINQMIISAILTELGHGHYIVENGRDAVEAVHKAAYDIILMDIRMPEMDGMQALRAIRDAGGAPAALPIIALTADISTDHLRMYNDLGFNAISHKPVDVRELTEAINTAIGEDIHTMRNLRPRA